MCLLWKRKRHLLEVSQSHLLTPAAIHCDGAGEVCAGVKGQHRRVLTTFTRHILPPPPPPPPLNLRSRILL